MESITHSQTGRVHLPETARDTTMPFLFLDLPPGMYDDHHN
jgi:hypothetical protein